MLKQKSWGGLRELEALKRLPRDGRVLFISRMVRMFAYGFISVVLVLYWKQRGLDERQIGLLLTGTLIGDVILSLWITARADRAGRRRMLIIGAVLMIFAGATSVLSDSLTLMVIAAVVGTISPSGNEVGSFLSIEQAALAQLTSGIARTSVFAWYNLIGSFSTAFGALAAGIITAVLQAGGSTPLDSYRFVLAGYGVLGGLLLMLFGWLSHGVEAQKVESAPVVEQRWFGLHRSRGIVLKLSGLFMVDAFAGGLILQSVMVYWFVTKFDARPEALGGIFFGANVLAGLSALVAGRLAARIGLVNTMVWTHIPSNILLMLVPLMPTLPLAVLLLLLRASLSQMDVPTRQSYVMSVVAPDERSAAAGITTIARTTASAAAPSLTGGLFALSFLSVPFFLAGALKIAYDLTLWRNFRRVKAME